jgi:serralysin
VPSLTNADLIWASTDNAANDFDGAGPEEPALGWADFPGSIYNPAVGDEQSVISINWQAYDLDINDPNVVVRGSYSFITLIHELGHALGLAHPHEGGAGDTPFPGVGNDQDVGSFAMNQGIWTTMSYVDGWRTAPHGESPSWVWGWQASPMALDIAALQAMYGANMSFRTGSDTYRLPDGNGVGTFYSCIWDAGGTDRIEGAANRANTIDLRAATLEVGPGAGGYVSYAKGIHGGYTIAKGAVIENAKGGGRSDLLRGNEVANTLDGLADDDKLYGRGGADRLWGGSGDDTLRGGDGNDVLGGGTGKDILEGGSGADDLVFNSLNHSAVGSGRDTIRGFAAGVDDIVLTKIDANGSSSGDGAFRLDTGGSFSRGEIRQTMTSDGLLIRLNVDTDRDAEMEILVTGVTKPLTDADFLF